MNGILVEEYFNLQRRTAWCNSMKKPTVTIGIPAYNEESNIGVLLSQLLRQKQIEFVFEKIKVASDGSEDNTAKIVKEFSEKNVVLINNRHRNGAWYVQNQIIQSTRSEILVFLDADVSINDPMFISKLIKPIIDRKADLTSSEIIPLPPKSFIEKMLYVSVFLKREIYKSYKNGNNIYTCHGQARGFSRKLYKDLRFKNKLAEDAFSYLRCNEKGGKYHFVPNAEINYKLPDNWRDHERQSIRFFKSQMQYKNDKWRDWVEDQYRIPLTLTLRKLIKYCAKHPIEMSCYLLSLIYIKIRSLFVRGTDARWDIALSSKRLN